MKIDIPDEHALVLLCISQALDGARRAHPQPFPTAHHALDVMQEKVDAFKAVIARRRLNRRRLEAEALDLAAVAASEGVVQELATRLARLIRTDEPPISEQEEA
jgi:hypothetical protein